MSNTIPSKPNEIKISNTQRPMVLLFLPSDEKKDYFGYIFLWSWVFYVTIVDCTFIRFCLVRFWYKYICFGIIRSGGGMYLFAFVLTSMENMCFVVVPMNKSPHYQINQRTNHTDDCWAVCRANASFRILFVSVFNPFCSFVLALLFALVSSGWKCESTECSSKSISSTIRWCIHKGLVIQ